MHIGLSFIRHKAAVNPVICTFYVGGQKKSIFNVVLGSHNSTSMLRSPSQKVLAEELAAILAYLSKLNDCHVELALAWV